MITRSRREQNPSLDAKKSKIFRKTHLRLQRQLISYRNKITSRISVICLVRLDLTEERARVVKISLVGE